MEDVAAPYPMKRIGEPKEIAALAVFLASDRCRFLTGQSINVDGGISIQGGWASTT